MTFERRPHPGRRLLLGLLGLLGLLAACQDRGRSGPLGGDARAERRPADPALVPGASTSSGAGISSGGGAASGSGASGGASGPRLPGLADEPGFGMGALRPDPPPRVRVAVIGDYGWAGPAEQQVAELVDSFQPDYVITTGDNNYPSGEAATIDQNIGQYFSHYIHPYKGSYPSSATHNRFFPTLGNHDWYTPGAEPYLDYFTLPGNERYYDVVWGDLHYFAIDSDEREPDGNHAASVQALWLRQALAASTQAFNVVAMHHPPYSSASHGSTPAMQWPFAEWGADLVLAGHDHGYERLEIGGITYVVTGLGGVSMYSFGEPLPGSVIRYNAQFGATVLDVERGQLKLSFFNVDGRRVDSATIVAR